MYDYRVNGVPLVLFPDTEASTEFQHPITAEELTDAFTRDLTVPVRGNERVLGHVHELALRQRTIRIDGVEQWRRGAFAHRGVFYVQGSTEGPDGTVSLQFSVNGFISQFAGKELRDADYGPDIMLPDTGELIADASYKNTLAWPAARYCYPMYYNPDAYGDANPGWMKDVPEYDPEQDYDVTTPPTLVRYTKDSVVRRERVYKCIGTAPAGENPDNTPWDWELYAQGIVNPWRPVGMAWLENSEATGNNCTMCPQFYLKDILTRALASHGYTAKGAFMDDADTHRLVLHNNYLLDEGEREGHVLASQTTPVTWTAVGPTYGRVVCQDDSTPPNEDPDTRWNTGTATYTPEVAGVHRFRVRVKFTSVIPCMVKVEVRRLSDFGLVGLGNSVVDLRTNWDFIFNFSRSYAGGDLTEEFFVRVVPQVRQLPNLFYSDSFHSITLSDCYFEAWIGPGDPVNVYAKRILPKNHVPDITIEHLLLDLRDRFHLRIRPSTERGVVLLDYQEDIMDKPVKTDITHLLRSPISFDHTARTPGLRFNSPSGRAEDLPDLSEHQDYGAVVSEVYELAAPEAELLKVHIKSSGQLLVSRLYDTTTYGWFIAGTLNPDASVGESENARVIAPELATPDMDEVPTHYGEPCLMPVIKEKCSGAMFGLGYNPPSLLIYFYHGLQIGALGGTYPFASPYRYDSIGTEVGQLNLTYDPDDAKSLYSKRWKRWGDLLTNSYVLDVDVDVTTLITPDGVPLERYMARNQVVLFDLMPVTDRNDRAPLISRARLLKLPNL